MRPLLRSWRVLFLAWALVAAPQLTLVHALSHLAPRASAGASADDRQQAPDKVCDACLALAHLGHALTTQHTWAGPTAAPCALEAPVCQGVVLPWAAHFQARAPPVHLS
ncbi:MAG: hypothetical protein KF891_00425 [Rhizobacter sp.]|nr:hypothetical protein [Rhizobacter sp.]